MRSGCSQLQLSERDREIVRTLTLSIRVLTAHQIRRTWWQNAGYSYVQQRLGALVHAGVLSAFQVRAHPELHLREPVWSWSPGESSPPFGVLSYRLRSRWAEPPRVLTVFTASRRSGRVYAGRGGRLSHPLQVTHDLHVSAIYLRLLCTDYVKAGGWISDDSLARIRRGKKIPDAEIHSADGIPLKVIEFGGAYPPQRLQKVHEDCERRQIPYELW